MKPAASTGPKLVVRVQKKGHAYYRILSPTAVPGVREVSAGSFFQVCSKMALRDAGRAAFAGQRLDPAKRFPCGCGECFARFSLFFVRFLTMSATVTSREAACQQGVVTNQGHRR
jgi:hypothetical protein